MESILNFIQKCSPFGKEPQKIGLCQIKEEAAIPSQKKEVSLRNKDIKLSDLMRRAG